VELAKLAANLKAMKIVFPVGYSQASNEGVFKIDMTSNSELVYSTNKNLQRCPKCGKLICECRPGKKVPAAQQTLRISLDRKGRKGKSVTLIEGFHVNPSHLADIAKSLKQFLGSGGTAKEGHIEIQGDHRKKAGEKLLEMGYRVKTIGG